MTSPATRRLMKVIGVGLALVVFTLALVTLREILSEVEPTAVLDAFLDTEKSSIFLGLFFTFLSYLALTGYDAVALAHLRHDVSYRRSSLASFTSYAIANNLGLPVLTGGSVRLRVYSLEGLSPVDIAVLTGICSLTFLLGIAAALGLAFLIGPDILSHVDKVPPVVNQAIGVGIFAGLGAYLYWVSRKRRSVSYRGYRIRLPGVKVNLVQITIAMCEIGFAAAVLYAVLPADTDLHFVTVACAFIAAIGLGVLSHAPGGLGVFEAVIFLALPQIPVDQLLASLLLFRCLYYLVPLAVAALLLAYHEASHPKGLGRRLGDEITFAVGELAPVTITAVIIVIGAILVLTGAGPAAEGRRLLLFSFTSLPIIEIAHLATSVVGLTLIVLARGLSRRLIQSFRIARILLFAALILALLRGVDVEETVLIVFGLLVLQSSRRVFYRPGHALDAPFTAPWTALLVGTILVSIWIGSFIHKAVPFTPDLWTSFTLDDHAARFTRTTAVLIVLVIGFQIFVSLRKTPGPLPGRDVPQAVRAIVQASVHPLAHRALQRDKRFLLSPDADTFLMYGTARRSFVSLGGPVGARSAASDLLWSFRDVAERGSGRPAIYDAPEEDEDLYRDVGLAVAPIGEAAIIDLTGFDPDIAALDRRRLAKHAITLETVPAARVPNHMAGLRALADRVARNTGRETRGFAVGRFEEDYVSTFDCVTASHRGGIVGFASFRTPIHGRATLDLLMARKGLGQAALTALVAKAAESARGRGATMLDLGLTPLDDLDTHPLWPVWRRIGPGLFPHGDQFATFADLRAFKARFRPFWAVRHLATLDGLSIPAALYDTAILTIGSDQIGKLRAARRARDRLLGRRKRDQAGAKAANAPTRM